MRLTLRTLAGVLPFLATSARAATFAYTISVPDGREAKFELPFSVEYPGSVAIEAEWTGPRFLYFGVEGPGHAQLSQRSGPSPQRLELNSAAPGITAGVRWTLTIKALPAHGGASGRLRVTVPDPPAVVAKREAELHPPPPPPPALPPWALPRLAPQGSPQVVARVYGAIESVRSGVMAVADASDDGCGWQLGFLSFVASARDHLAASPPDDATLTYFARVAEAIRSVESLRSGTDRLIAGPVPENRLERRDWLIARNEIVRPIERSLDQLTELLRGGHAPALVDERWIPRLNACLTACERYYDERVRFGGDENAPNQELAAAQWELILAAGRTLDALVALSKEPLTP